MKGFLYFLSPECGKFILKIPSNSKLGTYNQDYQKSIESIQRIQKNPAGYEPILKNKIIRGLELLPDENKFLQLATNLNCFIDATIKDFEIFINTSNHESILVKFELEKSQFVEEVRQVLERISSSVLAVPISFAAALFAIKDVSNLWMLSILKFSFLLFTIFSSIINIFYFFELNNIKKEIAVKINFYSSNILFIKNELENKMNGTKLKATFLQFLTICVILLFIVFIVVFFTLRIQESTSSAIELQCIL